LALAGSLAGASALDLIADQERSPLLAAPDESPPITASVDPPAPEVEFGLPGHIDRAEIPWLCVRLQVLAASIAADRLVCDVGAIVEPDAVTVDALARLQLTARRSGREMGIRHASRELEELLDLTGLAKVIRSAPDQASRRGGRPKSGK
jgi:ABC-type transporter Mla MlaB component